MCLNFSLFFFNEEILLISRCFKFEIQFEKFLVNMLLLVCYLWSSHDFFFKYLLFVVGDYSAHFIDQINFKIRMQVLILRDCFNYIDYQEMKLLYLIFKDLAKLFYYSKHKLELLDSFIYCQAMVMSFY